MTWNWQKPGWPDFIFDAAAIHALDGRLMQQAGVFSGTLRHIGAEDKGRMVVDLISDEALDTSAIEGEILNRESVQSSIRRNFGLDDMAPKAPPAEQGIAEMMVDLYQNYDAPLSQGGLCAWHEMLTKGRRDLRDIGRYRTHPEPMQVVSRSLSDPRVHFEAPPSAKVPAEMERFIDWFNRTAPGQEGVLSPLIRASIAHLYFVCIHPFEDGNGRIARAIVEKALSQSFGQPTLIALSHVIKNDRKIYYQALEDNNKNLEVTDWLKYFAGVILNAQTYSQMVIDYLIEKTRLYDRLRGQLNDRQSRAMDRMFRAGPDGFTGGMSAEKYIKITGASRATATRDLHDLAEKGALVRQGSLRHTRYFLSISS